MNIAWEEILDTIEEVRRQNIEPTDILIGDSVLAKVQESRPNVYLPTVEYNAINGLKLHIAKHSDVIIPFECYRTERRVRERRDGERRTHK